MIIRRPLTPRPSWQVPAARHAAAHTDQLCHCLCSELDLSIPAWLSKHLHSPQFAECLWHASRQSHISQPAITLAQQTVITAHHINQGMKCQYTFSSCRVAGMVAGLAQTLIITPVDLLKIRQQIQTSLPGTAGYVGPLQLLVRIFQREGVAGMPSCRRRLAGWTTRRRGLVCRQCAL